MLDTVLQISIAVGATLLASFIVYLFRHRQLYLAIPQQFPYAPNNKGKRSFPSDCRYAELRLINRGRPTEEDIQIELAPTRSYKFLSATKDDVRLEKNTLQVGRLCGRHDASILLKVTGGEFGALEVVTVSSKQSTGTVVGSAKHVPPNRGYQLAAMCFTFLLGVSCWYTVLNISTWTENIAQAALPNAALQGWGYLGSYYFSDLRASYSDSEFPLLLEGMEKEGENFILVYTAVNKTAVPLEVGSILETFLDPKTHKKLTTTSIKLPPLSKKQLCLRVASSSKKDLPLGPIFFTLKLGGTERIYLTQRFTD